MSELAGVSPGDISLASLRPRRAGKEVEGVAPKPAARPGIVWGSLLRKKDNVDFTAQPETMAEIIELPNESDSLADLEVKLRRAAAVIDKGRSLARYTGFEAMPSGSLDVVEAARKAWSPQEERLWDLWHEAGEPPYVDWSRRPKELPEGSGKREVLKYWAAALRYIYEDEDLDERHVVAFKKQAAEAIPLVTAVVKLFRAKNGLTSGVSTATPELMAEYNTCQKFAGTASAIINTYMEAIHRLTKSIGPNIQVVQERSNQIAAKLEIKQPHEGPANRERALLKRQRIGAKFDDQTGPSGVREKRTRYDIAERMKMYAPPAEVDRASTARSPSPYRPQSPGPSTIKGGFLGAASAAAPPTWQGLTSIPSARSATSVPTSEDVVMTPTAGPSQ